MNIIIARKPLEGNCVANVLEHGTGGICIDKCRVSTEGENLGDHKRFDGVDNHTREEWHRPHMTDDVMSKKHSNAFSLMQVQGRFPANIIHNGSVSELFPTTTSGTMKGKKGGFGNSDLLFGANSETPDAICYADTGNASRFFYNIGEN